MWQMWICWSKGWTNWYKLGCKSQQQNKKIGILTAFKYLEQLKPGTSLSDGEKTYFPICTPSAQWGSPMGQKDIYLNVHKLLCGAWQPWHIRCYSSWSVNLLMNSDQDRRIFASDFTPLKRCLALALSRRSHKCEHCATLLEHLSYELLVMVYL